MRLVIQRVANASVNVPAEGYEASIGKGLLVLAAFIDEDTEEDLEWCARKLAAMRIFDDADGVMNLSVKDVDGEILAVSQFTLYASTVKGNRPRRSRMWLSRCTRSSLKTSRSMQVRSLQRVYLERT